MKLTACCVALGRGFGRTGSLTPGRVESSAFILDPESASENRSQSEPERLWEGLGGPALGAAGCWVGMSTARPPGGRLARDPRGDAVRGRIKRKAGEAARRGPRPCRRSQPVRGAGLRPRVRRGAETKRQHPEGLRAQPQPSRAGRLRVPVSAPPPFTHPREQLQPRQPSPSVLGSARRGP